MNQLFSRRIFVAMCLFVTVVVECAVADPEKTTVTELAPGVFFRKTQTEPEFIGCNQGWVVFRDYVLVIDANFPNQAEEVIKLIRKHTDKPIRYVFDTHHHGDHADGNGIFTKLGAAAIASERSRIGFETIAFEGFEKMKTDKPEEYGELDFEYPSVWFPQKIVFEDAGEGGQRVELIYFGHGHTVGDAVAWLPKQRILFTGDACVNGPFNYMGESNPQSWIAVLNAMHELDPKVVAPGHGELGGREVVENQRRYFSELRATVKKMIDNGASLERIKEKIDIPFFKEWTGVDVKERVGNIEVMYGDLTGDGGQAQ
ncbi:MAG: MBL fold metallo-hydrolase [Pirellulaceae bacterium]|nr:MBL fold metallo-hydrolase [Pirellulaceae bacterium]